ncbi:hypothetical protein B0H13DRAFT_2349366 [Mycena leptocephala]|nr:hypothetical protein B0H13DRAFT_2349366 [Mycena leptocephala]
MVNSHGTELIAVEPVRRPQRPHTVPLQLAHQAPKQLDLRTSVTEASRQFVLRQFERPKFQVRDEHFRSSVSMDPQNPLFTDPGIVLGNTSAVQGTSFVWIGGDGFPNANAIISTAPKPEGPWAAPVQFYSGTVGNGTLGAYSALAHPSLTDGTGDYIFITWTKTRPDPATGFDVYDQPLVRVDWK